MSQTSVSILALTESCISKFDSLLALYARDSQRVEPLETRLADFNLWADGVGALAKPGASLDSRLQSRVNDLTLVKNALIMLADSLDHWVGLAEDTTNHDGTDHHEAIQNIDSAIKSLALIGVAIRRTGRASRNRRAYKTFNPDNHQELRTHLECIIRLRPTKEALFHQTENGEYVAKLDNSKLSDIQNRLIEANLRRRHMFLIAQKYSRAQRNVHIRPLIPVAPSPAGNILKEEPFANTGNADEANNQNPTPYSITGGHESTARTISDFSLASTAEGTLQYTPATRKYTPSITKTQITFIASDVEFPKAPSIHPGREIVKCPCCCQSLPIGTLQNPKSWKQHIVEDLCPYTCIAENCPTPQLLFCTRNEWESHVKETHLSRWECPFCEEQNEDYSTMESMGHHLQYAHREELLENSLATLLTWSTVQTMGIKSCPLCSSSGPEDSPELVDHVLRHAYDFALRALPWPQPIEYDLNTLPGSFTLPKDSGHKEDLQDWIKETAHESVGPLELQLSDYDRKDHSASIKVSEYTHYFDENSYFDDRSEDGSSKPQIDQSNASTHSAIAKYGEQILSALPALRQLSKDLLLHFGEKDKRSDCFESIHTSVALLEKYLGKIKKENSFLRSDETIIELADCLEDLFKFLQVTDSSDAKNQSPHPRVQAVASAQNYWGQNWRNVLDIPSLNNPDTWKNTLQNSQKKLIRLTDELQPTKLPKEWQMPDEEACQFLHQAFSKVFCECEAYSTQTVRLKVGTYRQGLGKPEPKRLCILFPHREKAGEWIELLVHDESRSEGLEAFTKRADFKTNLCSYYMGHTVSELRLDLVLRQNRLDLSDNPPIRRTSQSLSLQQQIDLKSLLSIKEKNWSGETKVALAVILAYALLYMHSESHFRSIWRRENIIFFHDGQKIPLQPFIGMPYPQIDMRPSIHVKHPSIVMLGVILLEIYVDQRLESFLGMDYEITDDYDLYLGAWKAYKKLESEIAPPQYKDAVYACLNARIFRELEIDDEKMRSEVFQYIIKPLDEIMFESFDNRDLLNLDQAIAEKYNLASGLSPPLPKLLFATTSLKHCITEIHHPTFTANRNQPSDLQ